jgi:hypothetical protein
MLLLQRINIIITQRHQEHKEMISMALVSLWLTYGTNNL